MHTLAHTSGKKCAWKKKNRTKAWEKKKKANWKNRIDKKVSPCCPPSLPFGSSHVSVFKMQKYVESIKIERNVKILYIEMKRNEMKSSWTTQRTQERRACTWDTEMNIETLSFLGSPKTNSSFVCISCVLCFVTYLRSAILVIIFVWSLKSRLYRKCVCASATAIHTVSVKW